MQLVLRSIAKAKHWLHAWVLMEQFVTQNAILNEKNWLILIKQCVEKKVYILLNCVRLLNYTLVMQGEHFGWFKLFPDTHTISWPKVAMVPKGSG